MVTCWSWFIVYTGFELETCGWQEREMRAEYSEVHWDGLTNENEEEEYSLLLILLAKVLVCRNGVIINF